MLNTISLQGRLTKEPELRYTTTQKPVCSFTLACDRDFGDKVTDFIDVVAWNQTAEFVCKYFEKGQLVAVSGRLQTRTWTDRNEQKRKETEIVAERAYFCEAKKDRETNAKEPKMQEIGDEDGELPF